MKTNKEIKKLLEGKREELYISDLEKDVINIILNEGDEDIKNFIETAIKYGCSCGHVSSLVWYNQTKEFFIKNMDDIFELLEEGEIPPTLLNANTLAWLGFERTLNDLVEELELLEEEY